MCVIVFERTFLYIFVCVYILYDGYICSRAQLQIKKLSLTLYAYVWACVCKREISLRYMDCSELHWKSCLLPDKPASPEEIKCSNRSIACIVLSESDRHTGYKEGECFTMFCKSLSLHASCNVGYCNQNCFHLDLCYGKKIVQKDP